MIKFFALGLTKQAEKMKQATKTLGMCVGRRVCVYTCVHWHDCVFIIWGALYPFRQSFFPLLQNETTTKFALYLDNKALVDQLLSRQDSSSCRTS